MFVTKKKYNELYGVIAKLEKTVDDLGECISSLQISRDEEYKFRIRIEAKYTDLLRALSGYERIVITPFGKFEMKNVSKRPIKKKR